MKYFGAFLIFLFAAIYITFPLIFHLSDLSKGLGDEIVISWIQTWNIHSFQTNVFNIFNANIYFPFKNSLAFSDLFISSSLLSFIPYLILKEPIATYNFTLLTSITLVGFSLFLFSYYITKDFFSSLLSGILVIFAPVTIDKFTHVQVLSLQWFLLSVYFYILFMDRKRIRYLIISVFFFIFQMYNSFLPGYFIAFSVIVFTFYYTKKLKVNIRLFSNPKFVFIFLLGIILVLPAIKPYVYVSKQLGLVRDIRDSIHFALQPEDLIFPNEYTRLEPILLFVSNTLPHVRVDEVKTGYLGLVFSFFVIISLYYFIRRFKKQNYIVNSLLILLFFGLMLSFGPALHIGRQTIHKPFPIILPYALFYYIIPGFNGLRNSARWEMLFVICSAILISVYISNKLKSFQLRQKVLIYALLFVGVVGEFKFPLKLIRIPQVNEFPKEYSWIAENVPKNANIIELPIYNWYMQPFVGVERNREYYSTIHFRYMVNGASGFSPIKWQAMVEGLLRDFPSENTIHSLETIGVTYIVLHADEYDKLYESHFTLSKKVIGDGNSVLEDVKKSKSFNLEQQFGRTFIYKIK